MIIGDVSKSRGPEGDLVGEHLGVIKRHRQRADICRRMADLGVRLVV